MESRFSFVKAAPGAFKALLAVEQYLSQCGLEGSMLDLMRLRASQINGCAYCLDMHAKDLRAAGESEQRIYLLDAWREAPFYTERERAALEWTEAITLLGDGQVPDATYAKVSPHFNDKELADLTLAVTSINSWNRINIASRRAPGDYQPRSYGKS